MLEFRNAVAGLVLSAAMILGTVAATTLSTTPAVADPVVHGFVTANLNLWAGPSTDYPIVANMQTGDPVTIHGCLSDWSWCDVTWYGERGWAPGNYVDVLYNDHDRPIPSYGQYFNLPFLNFNIHLYWHRHYRHRRFYGNLPQYEGRYHHHYPPPSFYRGHPYHRYHPQNRYYPQHQPQFYQGHPHHRYHPHHGPPFYPGHPHHRYHPQHRPPFYPGHPHHRHRPQHHAVPNHGHPHHHRYRPQHHAVPNQGHPHHHRYRPPHRPSFHHAHPPHHHRHGPPHLRHRPHRGHPSGAHCRPGQHFVNGACR